MKRNQRRTTIRSVLSRGARLNEHEIAADLHFPAAGPGGTDHARSANRAERR